MEDQLKVLIKRAEEEELGSEFSEEAIAALVKALPSIAPGFPSLADCLMSGDLYEEAEKYYYEADDEFPLKYSSALKSIAITERDETEFNPEEVEDIEEDEEPERGSTKQILGDTPRQKVIEREINLFCKKAADDGLDGIEMRSEAIKALKIGANRICYKKKFYDAENDKFIIFPSVEAALIDSEIYDIAQKKYYGLRDEFPLKYISALRSLGIEAGGAEEDWDEMMGMAADCESTDGFFENKRVDMFHTARLEFLGTPDNLYENEPQQEAEKPVTRGSTEKILGDTPRQKCVEREVNFFVKKAADEHLDDAMRDEAIKALKLAANKLAYKRKFYDAAGDTMHIFPSVAACLLDGQIYEEAEKLYYERGDAYPLKYISALRSLGVECGGAEEDAEEWDPMAMDCESTDGFFNYKPPPSASKFDVPEDIMEPEPEPEKEPEVKHPERGSTIPVLKDTPRQKCIERDINFFCKKVAAEHLDGVEMLSDAIIALKVAANQVCFKRKYYDAENDKFIVYPTVTAELSDPDFYRQAQKKYLGMKDEFPKEYRVALKSMAIESGGAEENYDDIDDMAADCESVDGHFEKRPLPDIWRTARLEFEGMPDELYEPEKPEPEPEPEEGRGSTAKILGDTPRQKCIERELDYFVKKAGEEHLDDEMRDEAIKAIKIAAKEFAYKRKMYDAGDDVMRVFPSVANCLIDGAIYEEAEKHYYEKGDEFPLKYISAFRSLGVECGGAEEEVEEWDPVAMDCESTDGYFDKKPLPKQSEFEWSDSEEEEEEEDDGRGSTAKILGDTPRQKVIEAEVDAFVRKAGEEHLDDQMRNEAIKALKVAANKYAYKKKFYDAEKDSFVVFPSIAWCMIDNDIYEEAEKHYYEKEDEFPLKYTGAMRSLGIECGGAEEDVEHMMEMAQDCESTDGFFEKRKIYYAEEKKKKKTKKKTTKKKGTGKKKSKKDDDKKKSKRASGEAGEKKKKKAGRSKSPTRKSKSPTRKSKSRSKSPSKRSKSPDKKKKSTKRRSIEDQNPLLDAAAFEAALESGAMGGGDEANTNPFSKILGTSARQQQIEKEINHYCTRAGKEQLQKEMRLEGVKALKIAANKFAYKKKKDGKLIPSIVDLLSGADVYDEAEKYYYDPEDEYPLKYTAALRQMALDDGGEALAEGDIEGDDVGSDDELFDTPGDDQDRDNDGRGSTFIVLGSSPREMLIEAEVDMYCKRAGEEQLDKPMRDEGIKALKIAADKMVYRKKFYDSSNDKMIIFPTLAECLMGAEVYEEAEKYYYDEEDEYPLKYKASLKDIVLADAPEHDSEDMEAMAMDVDENDEFFKTKLRSLKT